MTTINGNKDDTSESYNDEDDTSKEGEGSKSVIKFERKECTSRGIYIILFVILILFLLFKFIFG